MLNPALTASLRARDGDAARLIDRMTVKPPPGRAALIDQTIRRLKSHGIWQKLDVLWVMAAHDSQAARLNWKGNSSFDLTAVNSPTFTADRGYAGNGSTSYLNTNWVPSSSAVRYVQNDAMVFQYLNAGDDTVSDARVPTGTFGATGDVYVLPRAPAGGTRHRLNATGSQNVGSVSTGMGFTCGQRTSSTANEIFRNGASLGTASQASSGLPNVAPFICGANSGGSLIFPTNDRVAFCGYGASLTAPQQAAFYAIVYGHMRAVGAQHA